MRTYEIFDDVIAEQLVAPEEPGSWMPLPSRNRYTRQNSRKTGRWPGQKDRWLPRQQAVRPSGCVDIGGVATGGLRGSRLGAVAEVERQQLFHLVLRVDGGSGHLGALVLISDDALKDEAAHTEHADNSNKDCNQRLNQRHATFTGRTSH